MKIAICLGVIVVSAAVARPVAAQDASDIAARFALETRCAEAACIGDAANACMDFDPQHTQTTSGMAFCFYGEAGVWADRLDVAFEDALTKAKEWDRYDAAVFPEYSVREDQVQASQTAWLAYRDAQCEMTQGRYGKGTLGRVVAAGCWNKLTGLRAFELEAYAQEKG